MKVSCGNLTVLAPDSYLPASDAVNNLCDIFTQDDTSKDEFVAALRKIEGEVFFKQILLFRESGVCFLVNLRAYLIRQPGNRDIVDALKVVLTPFFGVSATDLVRVSLESSGALIERVIAGEQVHPYQGLGHVKRRFGERRRCYALISKNMAKDEPLAFVHVALTDQVAPSLEYIRKNSTSERDACAAIFYTISNAQPGLKGIDLGKYLIKRAVSRLRSEFPDLELFSTLSPIPGFLRWLRQQPKSLLDNHVPLLDAVEELKKLNCEVDIESSVLVQCLEAPWWNTPINDIVRDSLLHLAKVYITETKKDDGSALCPVANFHLGNGAQVLRINWGGDTTRKGMRNSAGIMVNYQYKLDELEKNSIQYKKTAPSALTRRYLALNFDIPYISQQDLPLKIYILLGGSPNNTLYTTRRISQ